MNQNGKCIIFSAPSGAGKTTIVRYLLEKLPQLAFSVSACSREPRGKEVNGKDYYFLGVEGFRQKIVDNAFVEWEEVYTNNFYGTLKSEIEKIWKQEKAVIFDVDVVGGLNLKKQFGDHALAVFVEPPSEEELEKRLRFRSTETEEKISMRMAKAKEELAFSKNFDVIIRNENLEQACEEAFSVVTRFLATEI